MFFQVVRTWHVPEAGHHLSGEERVRLHLGSHLGRKNGCGRVRDRALAKAHDKVQT